MAAVDEAKLKALADAAPLTAAGLAERTGTTPRCLTERLAAPAASGYVTGRRRPRPRRPPERRDERWSP